MSLFVGGLADGSLPRDVEALFSQFGPCEVDVRFRRGFAFIYFKARHHAEEAMQALNHKHVFGKRIEIKWKTEAPPRTHQNGYRREQQNQRPHDARHHGHNQHRPHPADDRNYRERMFNEGRRNYREERGRSFSQSRPHSFERFTPHNRHTNSALPDSRFHPPHSASKQRKMYPNRPHPHSNSTVPVRTNRHDNELTARIPDSYGRSVNHRNGHYRTREDQSSRGTLSVTPPNIVHKRAVNSSTSQKNPPLLTSNSSIAHPVDSPACPENYSGPPTDSSTIPTDSFGVRTDSRPPSHDSVRMVPTPEMGTKNTDKHVNNSPSETQRHQDSTKSGRLWKWDKTLGIKLLPLTEKDEKQVAQNTNSTTDVIRNVHCVGFMGIPDHMEERDISFLVIKFGQSVDTLKKAPLWYVTFPCEDSCLRALRAIEKEPGAIGCARVFHYKMSEKERDELKAKKHHKIPEKKRDELKSKKRPDKSDPCTSQMSGTPDFSTASQPGKKGNSIDEYLSTNMDDIYKGILKQRKSKSGVKKIPPVPESDNEIDDVEDKKPVRKRNPKAKKKRSRFSNVEDEKDVDKDQSNVKCMEKVPISLRLRLKPASVSFSEDSAPDCDISLEETDQPTPDSTETPLTESNNTDINYAREDKSPTVDEVPRDMSTDGMEDVAGTSVEESLDAEAGISDDMPMDQLATEKVKKNIESREVDEDEERPKKKGRRSKSNDADNIDLSLAWKLTREDVAPDAPPTTRSRTRRNVVVAEVEAEKLEESRKQKKSTEKKVLKSKAASKKEMKKGASKTISKKRPGRPPKNSSKRTSNGQKTVAKSTSSNCMKKRRRGPNGKLMSETVTETCKESTGNAQATGPGETVASSSEGSGEAEEEYDGECARTRLYRRMEAKAKEKKFQFSFPKNIGRKVDSRGVMLSGREKRLMSRTYKKRLDFMGVQSDAVKENELKNRNRSVFVSKSNIHGQGLFAGEDIEANSFVLEYVAESIRHVVADIREVQYKERGIGDSYLFALDSERVLDATHRGSMGRFINHSCNPNVTARIVQVGNQKRIIFYSKRKIRTNQEITYDYCFGAEEEEKKVACLCKLSNCRKYLN